MDVAPITIQLDSTKEEYEMSCNMPNYGNIDVTFYLRGTALFCRLKDYPIVTASVGIDLYMGLNTPYQFLILPTSGGEQEINVSNINTFWIGLRAK